MEKTSNNKSKVVIVLLVVIILLLVAVVAVFLLREDEDSAQSADPAAGLSYAAEGVTVVSDEDALQAAVDEMVESAKNGNIGLTFQNEAFSEDGTTFSCYLGNSTANSHDMYINIYSDLEMTDQLFLSGLIRPGEAFDSIELERELESGDHTVYCVFTLVEDDHATIRAQSAVALTFHVAE